MSLFGRSAARLCRLIPLGYRQPPAGCGIPYLAEAGAPRRVRTEPIHRGNKTCSIRVTNDRCKGRPTRCPAALKGRDYERCIYMAHEASVYGSEVHSAPQTDGGRSLLVGGDLEVCLYQSGHRAFHETGYAVP